MLCLIASRTPLARGPWFSFLIGIAIFSGSLYLLAVTNIRWLGAITPIGGVAFLVGLGVARDLPQGKRIQCCELRPPTAVHAFAIPGAARTAESPLHEELSLRVPAIPTG